MLSIKSENRMNVIPGIQHGLKSIKKYGIYSVHVFLIRSSIISEMLVVPMKTVRMVREYPSELLSKIVGIEHKKQQKKCFSQQHIGQYPTMMESV